MSRFELLQGAAAEQDRPVPDRPEGDVRSPQLRGREGVHALRRRQLVHVLEVLAEESAKDPLFKKVADNYLAWREQYKIWGDAQALKTTYQR